MNSREPTLAWFAVILGPGGVSEGHGEDAKLASRVDLKTTLALEPAGAGRTSVIYTSEVRVLGRLGSIGDAVMRAKAGQMAGEFARRVASAIHQNPPPPQGERAEVRAETLPESRRLGERRGEG